MSSVIFEQCFLENDKQKNLSTEKASEDSELSTVHSMNKIELNQSIVDSSGRKWYRVESNIRKEKFLAISNSSFYLLNKQRRSRTSQQILSCHLRSERCLHTKCRFQP